MRLELDRQQWEALLRALDEALQRRVEGAERAEKPEERQRLAQEARVLTELRERLARAAESMHAEELVDESVLESFPASDPPARSNAG